MEERITEFLDNKGINDDFIRNIVRGFINRHTELYGDIVPFENLMDRLNTNLDSINLIDPTNRPPDPKYQNVVGCYEGYDKNSISMFFTKGDLNNPQLREHFISILIHELTHCAYSIKQNDYLKSEKQIFGKYEQLLDGKTPLVEGNNTYMEPIVNYISTCIYGNKNGAYLAQTKNMAKLVSILGEKEIIRSAFNSDEEAFRQCFDVLPEGAYEYYTEGMDWLNGPGTYGFRRGTEIMDNFFKGNIPSLTERQRKIKELKTLKTALLPLEPLSQEFHLEQGAVKNFKKQGFIDIFLLTLIYGLVMLTFVIITLTLVNIF